MTCDPESVTGWVDEALPPDLRQAIGEHVETCPTCRDQADFERALRARLRELPAPEPVAGLELGVRERLRGKSKRVLLRYVLPVAASLVIAVLLGRGFGPLVAWQLSLEHDHCWGMPQLPALVLSDDPSVVETFFAREGTVLPPLPAEAGGVALIGARPCRLLDRGVAHLYYGSDDKRLSVFVVPGRVWLGSGLKTTQGRNTVELVRVGDSVVGLVSDDRASVDGFARALSVSFASTE